LHNNNGDDDDDFGGWCQLLLISLFHWAYSAFQGDRLNNGRKKKKGVEAT
jgi:hypothetical protein